MGAHALEHGEVSAIHTTPLSLSVPSDRLKMWNGIGLLLLVTMAQAAAFSEQCPAPVGNAAPYVAMSGGFAIGDAIYGTSVSIDASGQFLALGAEDHEDPQTLNGLVFVYERIGNSWSEMPGMPLVSGTDTAPNDKFGRSVSLDGNYLVVGGTTQGENSAGAAFAYVRKYDVGTKSSTWSTMRLWQTPEQHNSFGNSVSLSGEWLAVGAKDTKGEFAEEHAGAVYVYHRAKSEDGSGEEYRHKYYFNGDNLANANFGFSVSLEGNYLVVGANAENGNSGAYPQEKGTGAVYVYHRIDYAHDGPTWTETERLVGPIRANFGSTVSLSGNYLSVGAPLTGQFGAAHIFVRNGTKWTAEWQMGGDGVSASNFGTSVSLSGNYFVVTAQDESTNKGHAYMWYRNGTNWGQKSTYSLTGDKYHEGAPIPEAVSLSGSSMVAASREPFGYYCNPQHSTAPTTSTPTNAPTNAPTTGPTTSTPTNAPTTAPTASAVASSGWSTRTYAAVFGSIAAILVLAAIVAVIYVRKNIRWRWANLSEEDVDVKGAANSLVQHDGAVEATDRSNGVVMASHPL